VYPFRLGTTSYILPDDILPNVRYLAGRVRDIELVLFEVDDGPSNLPSASVIRELNAISRDHDMSYTVHLPLDLRLGDDGDEQHVSLIKARKVIDCTCALDPWAYVVHLDGREVHGAHDAARFDAWAERCVRALELVGAWAGGIERLAVENLDTYPPEHITPVLEKIAVSRCVDIGHLWLESHDLADFLPTWLPRTRVIHAHGIAERDHKSLAHVPEAELDSVLNMLLQADYRGVVTVEVFGEEDFDTSMAAIERSRRRICQRG